MLSHIDFKFIWNCPFVSGISAVRIKGKLFSQEAAEDFQSSSKKGEVCNPREFQLEGSTVVTEEDCSYSLIIFAWSNSAIPYNRYSIYCICTQVSPTLFNGTYFTTSTYFTILYIGLQPKVLHRIGL